MFTVDGFKVGDKVRVETKDPSSWATGCAQSLNGKTGVVTECKHGAWGPQVLVTFDIPPAPWWGAQRPVKAFHFSPEDLCRLD